MKGAVLPTIGNPPRLDEFPDPEPSEGEVIAAAATFHLRLSSTLFRSFGRSPRVADSGLILKRFHAPMWRLFGDGKACLVVGSLLSRNRVRSRRMSSEWQC